MKIVDCTIRDGGHLNKWHFEPKKVQESYEAANLAGVDYFEIGYRMPKTMEGLGEFGYCDDTYITNLMRGYWGDTKLLVMIDTGKANMDDFGPAAASPFWGVRVAAYPPELELALKQCEHLLSLGYHVTLNPMVSIRLTNAHVKMIAEWPRLKDVECVYIADSFGSFGPGYVTDFYGDLRAAGIPKLGFHAHNNMQLAVANTLEAVNVGYDFIDGTIYGMGRGAGNAPIEILTSFLPEKRAVPYLNLIKKWYSGEKNWGSDPAHVIGGAHGVHPYYTEKLEKEIGDFGIIEKILDKHSSDLPISYNEKAILEIIAKETE